MPDFHIYEALERPDLEVLVDGEWWPGEAVMRTAQADGTYTWHVHWHRDGSQYAGTFTADQLRPDTIDRSQGRS